MSDSSRLKGARILITGHTGFTGSWMSLKLAALGAEIHGFALAPETKPALFDLADIWSAFKSHTLGDLADFSLLSDTVNRVAPDAILHLAAQPLVLTGYAQPLRTFMTNTQGTAHILEAARLAPSVRGVVAITTDKVYAPDPKALPFTEGAKLGGEDPYSASKAAAELVIDGYRHSLAAWKRPMRIEVARGGNIFGGGDFAPHRIIPDFYRAVQSGSPLKLRKPNAQRPWQHVLDLCEAYRLLLERVLGEDARSPGENWNFGPEAQDSIKVIDLIRKLEAVWQPMPLEVETGLHETLTLALNSNKANSELGWTPRLSLDKALQWTADWYKAAIQHPDDLPALTRRQIEAYDS
ncbi:MAG: CDP-glucose 4,6-dehydratase [Pseudomonadota bacterium]